MVLLENYLQDSLKLAKTHPPAHRSLPDHSFSQKACNMSRTLRRYRHNYCKPE